MNQHRHSGRYGPTQEGFIALTSAIIISAILLLVAVTGGLTGIFARGDALDAELKARSASAADACADEALLGLASDPAYPGRQTFTLNTLDQCRISAVTSASGAYWFKVQATSSNAAVTNLSVSLKTSDLTVLSWQEIAQF